MEKAWEDLGMEPGVRSAYSVKNVEICPAGFCKRAKQNTLPLGMRLEKRFYGAPTPNRTKIGVAGCLNACGSVNAKDIGVLADPDGCIVVAGGSAGYHPRLPDRIAENSLKMKPSIWWKLFMITTVNTLKWEKNLVPL